MGKYITSKKDFLVVPDKIKNQSGQVDLIDFFDFLPG
jgi:hypothetical protein